jgi:tetratricopeptide (TPR) repeat protein
VIEAATELDRAEFMASADRYAEAISIAAQVIAADPDNSRAFAILAQAQLGAGQPDRALAAASRAVELDPASAWPHRLRSIALRRTGDPSGAIAAALEACKLDPHHWMNHFNLAQAALGLPSAAGVPGAAAADGAPGAPNGLGAADGRGEAGCSAQAGRLQLARQASAMARELAPDEPSAHYVSGLVSRASGADDEALGHFRRTLALDPEYSSAINELGRLKLERGNHGGAARDFIQAARLAPGQGAYGHNVEVAVARAERAVRLLASWVIYGSWLVFVAACVLTLPALAARIALLAALPVAAVAVAASWRIHLRRMPMQARQLFQARSTLLAMSVALASVGAGVAVVEFVPGARSGDVELLIVLLLFAARLAAFRVLREAAQRRHEQIASRSSTIRG